MTMNTQVKHYEDKLAFEIDSWDLNAALELGEEVVVNDARSTEAYRSEHIPGAINVPVAAMHRPGTVDWWKRDGHGTESQAAGTPAAGCGCD